MNLLLITSHYPYGVGEEFLEDEMRVAEKIFKRIIILSCSKSDDKTKYLPRNAIPVKCRKSRYSFLLLLFSLVDLFSMGTVREIYFSYSKLKFKNICNNLKQIYIYYYFNRVLSPYLIKEKYLNSDTMYYSYWMGPSAFALSKFKDLFPNTFCITRAHGGDCFIELGYLSFRREILEKMDEVFSVSTAGKNSIEKKLTCFVKDPKPTISIRRLGHCKKTLSLNPTSNSNVLRLVSCSMIIKLKRLDIIIDALSEIYSLKVEWLHFGDGEMREKIENYAQKKLGNNKNVVYKFFGYQSKPTIFKHYSSSHVDLFVNCSDCEGIPVSIMEALSFGIPAVARDVGGNNEIININNGFLLPHNSTYLDLLRALNTFNSLDQKERKSLSDCAYLTYKNFYQATINYSEFYNYIESKYLKNGRDS